MYIIDQMKSPHTCYKGMNDFSSDWWVCMLAATYNLVHACRTTAIFGTLEDDSLLINSLASNNCFSNRNFFQNGVDALSKIVDACLSHNSKFYVVRIIRNNVQIFVASGKTWSMKTGFKTSDVSICNNIKDPIGTSTFCT